MFREGSQVRQTPEEDQRNYRPKRYGNNDKDEDNSPKTLNDKSIDHPDYCIIKIGQNTEKCPGDLRRLTVTRTSGKNHQLTLV